MPENTQLVIGASGLVGQELMRRLKAANRPVVGTHVTQPRAGLEPLDISDATQVQRFFGECVPDTIYLCAALTHVDYCEEHPEETYRQNVEGPRRVAQEAARLGVKLVFYSTEYVFDGQNGPYDEQAPTSPLSVYGKSKLDAETVLREILPDVLILRTTVVYGWDPLSKKKNFAMQVYERVQTGQELTIPFDQIGNPTLADYLAECSIELAGKRASGIVNVVGKDLLPRTDFTRALVQSLGGDVSRVTPVTTASMKQKAVRPLRGGLRTEKLAGLLGREVLALDQALDRFNRRRLSGE
ncbi:MAG: SDR family oxidoreductase [Deltaproteobacteria bacterium]|nr:SDR family oxidoreductase [Deltaproteobacteria bacterium]